MDGHDLYTLFKDCEKITEIMYEFECDEVLFADTAQQKNDLWRMRRAVGEAVKSHSIYKEEDTVVPRAELPVLLRGVKEIGAKYGMKTASAATISVAMTSERLGQLFKAKPRVRRISY